MGMSCNAVTPRSARYGSLRATSRNVPPLCGRFGVKGADMELIDHELVKRRGDIAVLMPGKVGVPNQAFGGKRRFQFAGVGIALLSPSLPSPTT